MVKGGKPDILIAFSIAFILSNLCLAIRAQDVGTVKEIRLKSPAVDANMPGDTSSKKILV